MAKQMRNVATWAALILRVKVVHVPNKFDIVFVLRGYKLDHFPQIRFVVGS
jgi:hypothetical protein